MNPRKRKQSSSPPARRRRRATAWEAARLGGTDMSLIEAMLRRSPAGRVAVHERALRAALALRRAVEKRSG